MSIDDRRHIPGLLANILVHEDRVSAVVDWEACHLGDRYHQVLMSMQFMLSTIDAQNIFQRRPNASMNFCTLGLGFMEHTASSVINGILQSSAAKRRHAG
jgi:aminoglycoside phosphotransferase (APT) family kinase protein